MKKDKSDAIKDIPFGQSYEEMLNSKDNEDYNQIQELLEVLSKDQTKLEKDTIEGSLKNVFILMDLIKHGNKLEMEAMQKLESGELTINGDQQSDEGSGE